MKCPFKYRLQGFEGGETCDPECAWLVEVWSGVNPKRICAVTMIGHSSDMPRRPLNALEVQDEVER